MSKDIQKPILYKADPYLFAQIEVLKDSVYFKLNRNQFINEAVEFYVELVKLMQSTEYAYLNEVSFNDAHLQTILYQKLKKIARGYPPKSIYK